jgi:hypothetical protein
MVVCKKAIAAAVRTGRVCASRRKKGLPEVLTPESERLSVGRASWSVFGVPFSRPLRVVPYDILFYFYHYDRNEENNVLFFYFYYYFCNLFSTTCCTKVRTTETK